MKRISYIIGVIMLTVAITSCGGQQKQGTKFAPKDRESSLSDSERQAAIAQKKAELDSLNLDIQTLVFENNIKLTVLPPAATGDITEETSAAALPTVKAAAAFDYGMMAMNVIERLLAMLLHISLTVIVFYGVVSEEKRYLPLAIVLHMLMDTFAALYQRGAVPLWSVEVWSAFWTVVSVVIAVRLYRKMAER